MVGLLVCQRSQNPGGAEGTHQVFLSGEATYVAYEQIVIRTAEDGIRNQIPPPTIATLNAIFMVLG